MKLYTESVKELKTIQISILNILYLKFKRNSLFLRKNPSDSVVAVASTKSQLEKEEEKFLNYFLFKFFLFIFFSSSSRIGNEEFSPDESCTTVGALDARGPIRLCQSSPAHSLTLTFSEGPQGNQPKLSSKSRRAFPSSSFILLFSMAFLFLLARLFYISATFSIYSFITLSFITRRFFHHQRLCWMHDVEGNPYNSLSYIQYIGSHKNLWHCEMSPFLTFLFGRRHRLEHYITIKICVLNTQEIAQK